MRLLVGRIGRAHGIHGEATIEVHTDSPEDRFVIGARVQSDAHGELVIKSYRVHNGILLLGFENIVDRNAIEKLRDTLLYCEVDIEAPSEYEGRLPRSPTDWMHSHSRIRQRVRHRQ
jgi:16S rRNA processing protein RimM